MENNKEVNFENIISDIFKETRLKISRDDPVLATLLINEKLFDAALSKLKENNILVTESLKEQLTSRLQSINESIISIPDAIDSKIILLKQACSELHDEFQEGKGEYKGAINQASDELEKVIKSANKCVENINTHAEKVINSTLKKSLDNYDNTTNDIANKMDYSIRRAFEKSSKKLISTVIIAFIMSTVFQFSMWGWFVYILTR
ncbi:hypothetical protein [Arsenophonus nasoniae]|uniref:hypothetical protein n=1 Tax=Arsenophonus nasoniae TaxID=638 RepID=UPI003879B311